MKPENTKLNRPKAWTEGREAVQSWVVSGVGHLCHNSTKSNKPRWHTFLASPDQSQPHVPNIRPALNTGGEQGKNTGGRLHRPSRSSYRCEPSRVLGLVPTPPPTLVPPPWHLPRVRLPALTIQSALSQASPTPEGLSGPRTCWAEQSLLGVCGCPLFLKTSPQHNPKLGINPNSSVWLPGKMSVTGSCRPPSCACTLGPCSL